MMRATSIFQLIGQNRALQVIILTEEIEEKIFIGHSALLLSQYLQPILSVQLQPGLMKWLSTHPHCSLISRAAILAVPPVRQLGITPKWFGLKLNQSPVVLQFAKTIALSLLLILMSIPLFAITLTLEIT